ncbi:MAG: MoaD/ThiS family protein [Candidatus Omnitrophica bacterium]|nr:MoaD/ThiS family protein [Candidatus Omnitrophota bacterium]
MAVIRIPLLFQEAVGNITQVEVKADNLSELIGNLTNEFPNLKEKFYDARGSLSEFVNIYVNEEDSRFLEGEKTHLNDTDIIDIILPIAGG